MDLFISQDIGNEPGQTSSTWVKSKLAAANGEPINVRINSAGGSVFEGFAIYDAIRSYHGPKSCVIESAAFSIASVIAMAFDDRGITENGYLMVHNPHMDEENLSPGEMELLEKLRTRMIGIYASASGQSAKSVESLMNEEAFLDAGESIKWGFVQSIKPAVTMSRDAFSSMVAKYPRFRVIAMASDGMSSTEKWKQAYKAAAEQCKDASKAAKMVDQQHPGLRQRMIDEANRPKAIGNERSPSSSTARAQWTAMIRAKVSKGISSARAATMVNKENPGLREQMMADANQGRSNRR